MPRSDASSAVGAFHDNLLTSAPISASHTVLLPVIQGTTPGQNSVTEKLPEEKEAHDDTTLDSDQDGLADYIEAQIGTDPYAADSDCDYVNDFDEVLDPTSPQDSDGDTIINAVENHYTDANQNGIPDDGDPQSSIQINCARFTPFAIKTDGSETTRLEVRIQGGQHITRVSAHANFWEYALPTLDGQTLAVNDDFELYDDGTHGDQKAGDNLWTRGGFSAAINFLDATSRYTFRLSQFTIHDGDSTETIDVAEIGPSYTFSRVPLFFVHPDAIESPTVLADDTQYLSHLVNIVDPSLSYALKKAGRTSTAMAQRFYASFGDDYDFLFFYPDAYAVDAPYGSHRSVRNTNRNIGVSLFDNSQEYGSNGKLQGIIFMNLGGGPTLHELMHQWGVFGLKELGFNQCIDSAHWGVAGVGKGQLGGFDPSTLVDNGDESYTVDRFGTFANGGDSVSYSPLEKYLAGFAAAESVPPVTIPVNVDCASLDYSVQGKVTFRAQGYKTVTLAEIANHLGGPRSPDLTTSQKHFRAAAIVLSERVLTATELAVIHHDAKQLSGLIDTDSYSFSEATDGVATIDTDISTPDAAR